MTADLQSGLAALSPQKRALFEKLMARKAQQARAETVFPLSVMQEGIWFLEQLRPGTTAYVLPAALHLRGPLRKDPLRAAINEIVRRHESLRTTFQVRDGNPVQVLAPELTIDLPEQDLRAVAGDPAIVQAKIDEVVGEPFSLTTGPLLRFSLLRTGPDEHVLAVAMHHLITDGWSLGVLVSELAALYQAFVDRLPSPLPELKIQYGDFAIWQRQRLEQESGRADLEYWQQRLTGAPAALSLPTDRPRPAIQGSHGGTVAFEFPEPLMRELTELAKKHRATTFMALLAAFQVLLHRCSTQDGVVVGIPTVTRDRPETEPVIGYFINLLSIYTDLSTGPSFAQVLEQVRDNCLGAYAHQGLPLEKVVEAVRPERDLSRLPIFQVCFSYQGEPMSTFSAAGVEFSRLPFKAVGSRFDLEVQCLHDGHGGLAGTFEYDRDLFDESSIARLTGNLQRLVESAVAQPDRPVAELPLLADDERRRLLSQAAATGQSWPEAGWIHQEIESRARITPAAEAVRFEGHSLSYAQLNGRANRLARRLRGLGVGRDVLVGVSLERSLELVVSLLAVLKAGGAYVPLDPDYPPARLEYMVADANPPVLLTQRRLLARLPAGTAQVLCVEELATELAAETDGDLDVPVDGPDLAYMIYTSGSTGRPKGVMNTHEAIRNRLLWMQDEYGLTAADRVLQKTPFSFDVSVWEFFWPLMSGATLVVAGPGAHKDARYLVETIAAEQITTLHFVPSMLAAFLAEPGIEQLTGLRRVICSGEALSRDLQERFFARSGAELHNLYGPTEAAVDVSSWACRRDGDPRGVPIGYPIANTALHVLDQCLQPVPDGVPGELHIGGIALARGYLNQDQLTRERFIPDPFSAEPGARLYKTGDLARRRGDGALEYLGRLDRQVKLRGFRIELGEIEAALAGHPRVREAVVVARSHGPQDQRLVAYLTGEPVSTGELLEYLKERLPAYMVPAAFVLLPQFPLTANGKVDHAALPEPDLDRPELQTAFVAPQDDLERSIAALWCEVLGLERVGTGDNFFDLGGHSLLIPRLKTALSETLGRDVTMVELFQYPTVGSLAAYLHRPADTKSGPVLTAQARAESRRGSQDQRQQAAARRQRARTR